MSRPENFSTSADGGFPRVSGDEPVYDQLVRATLTFSPRERG